MMEKCSVKKGILVVSFGTTYIDALKTCIESCEKRIRNSFNKYEIRRAFTSGMVLRRLKEKYEIENDDIDTALKKMKNDGFQEVIVQPLHIIPGIEYEKIEKAVCKYKEERVFEEIVLGRPLLYSDEDYKLVIAAIKKQLPKLNSSHAVLFMAHGTKHFSNACYCQLQLMLHYEGLDNVFIGTVEGYPSINDLIPGLKERGINEVTLMPLMLVAGDHAVNDMAGSDENSWENILENEGFAANIYMHGLGENAAFQDIYVVHVMECI